MSALEVLRLRINPAHTWRSLQILQTGNPGNVVALRGPARSAANLAAHVQAEPGQAVNPMAASAAPGTKKSVIACRRLGYREGYPRAQKLHKLPQFNTIQ